MNEVFELILGICVLFLGIPIGNLLAKSTPEELKDGKKWFYLILFVCFIGSIFSLIFSNDALLFTFLFIAVVTSRSIKIKKKLIAKKEIKKNYNNKNKENSKKVINKNKRNKKTKTR